MAEQAGRLVVVQQLRVLRGPPAGEEPVGLLALVVEHGAHRLGFSAGQLAVPAQQFSVDFGPRIPIVRISDAFTQLAKPLLVAACAARTLERTLPENSGQGRQHLAGLHGLEQVVCELRPEGVRHEAFFFALGHHHHGQGRLQRLDLGQHVEPARPGHVLVQKDAVERLRTHQNQGICRVGCGNHLDSAPLEVQNVGAKCLDFVVNP